MTDAELNLIKAEQQLTGFYAGYSDESITDLVDSMGLSADEFAELQQSGDIDWLPDGLQYEIEIYLCIDREA